MKQGFGNKNKTRSAAAKRAWASRKRMAEARDLREKARIIHPAAPHTVKAEYKAKVFRTPYQTEMDLKK